MGYSCPALYAADDRYDFLKQGDIAAVAGAGEHDERFLRVTHIQKGTFGEFVNTHPEPYKARRFAAVQIGREVDDGDILTILEVERAYPHEWENL